MAREDDYTGAPIDDGDQLSLLEEIGVFEIDPGVEVLTFGVDDENETVLHFGDAANGARSLAEVAERLYDLADELLELSADGWEIVDDVVNGHGVAVRFETDETDDEQGPDDE